MTDKNLVHFRWGTTLSSKPADGNSSGGQSSGAIYVEKKFSTVKPSSSSIPMPVTQVTANLVTIELPKKKLSPQFEVDVEKGSLPYFKDLLALDKIMTEWTRSLTTYLAQKESHCVFHYWHGKSLTGKTTLAKRFCGLEGFAPFQVGGVKTFYYDCYHIKDHFEKLKADWADTTKTPYNSIIFIDEFEKCVHEKYKLVDEVFARKFRKQLEDLSRTQKIFFVFLSTEVNSRENVTALLDTKLASLTSFSAVFPDWTSEKLLEVILKKFSAKKFKIENEAAAELAIHASLHGKVMELQKVLQLLEVELAEQNTNQVSLAIMDKVLSTRR